MQQVNHSSLMDQEALLEISRISKRICVIFKISLGREANVRQLRGSPTRSLNVSSQPKTSVVPSPVLKIRPRSTSSPKISPQASKPSGRAKTPPQPRRLIKGSVTKAVNSRAGSSSCKSEYTGNLKQAKEATNMRATTGQYKAKTKNPKRLAEVEKLKEQAKKARVDISLGESSIIDLRDQPNIRLRVAATTPLIDETRVISLEEREPTPQASQEKAPSN